MYSPHSKYSIVSFREQPGAAVPTYLWPQKFYISAFSLDRCAYELRPLTITGLAKGIVTNFITMNWWRMCRLLRRAGFLNTLPGCSYSWRNLTLKFWITRKMDKRHEAELVQA